MPALISGSVAFDNIMVFRDSFKNHILPDQIHILNVAFLVPELRREFGGCAGNIAYNLKLLGDDPLPMGTVGEDFEPYEAWLTQTGIRLDHIRRVTGTYTAQAFITTDLDDNQITAFHPGAMDQSELNHVSEASGVTIGIVSPSGRAGMIQHAQEFAAAGIPFIFDPGQGLPMFEGDDLRQFVDQATWVAVNDYEWQMLQQRTGWDAATMLNHLDALVVTRGGEGARIHTKSSILEIPAAPVGALADPTGCGDAFRAGLLYGLSRGWDWPKTGRLAALLGAIKIESHGTQNHRFDRESLADRFEAAYGESLFAAPANTRA